MSDFFRIIRGLEIDETVRVLQGPGAPGHTSDTDDSLVGSIYTDNVAGTLYTKTTTGTGPAKWTPAGTGGAGGSSLVLVSEYPVAAVPPAALGQNSIALGSGAHTDVNAPNTLAIGDQSFARLYGGVYQASGRFQSTGDAQSGRYLLRTHTVNGAVTEAFLDGTGGSARLLIPDDSTWTFKATIVGHRTDQTGGHAGYTVEGVVYRTAGAATVALLGTPVKTILAESNTPWDINIVADPTHGSLKITMTGQTGKTIRWLALVETVEITN